ncbi:MAG: ATP-dependent DNA helicase, partial [Edaphobacter sp.]
VNHHLFFADLSIKQQAANAPDAGILPEATAVIFDEAHELEDIASNYFGIGLSNQRVDELIRDVDLMLKAKKASTSAIESACATLKERSRMFFAILPMETSGLPGGAGRMPFHNREAFLEESGDYYTGVTNALTRLEGELDHLKNVEESPGLRKRAADIRTHLTFLLESPDRNTVFWIERRATGGVRNLARTMSHGAAHAAFHTHLQATPIDVSELLTSTLFDNYNSIILTSATLTVSGGFDHIRRRLGLTTTRELVVPSHFNYEKQALLYLPPNMPDPREPDFPEKAAERIRRVLEITKGRAFCLFTSYTQMRNTHERLLAELPYPLLLHGTAPRHVLLQ